MGHCKDCALWDLNDELSEGRRWCTSDKICERWDAADGADNLLVYSYNEGGSFSSGPEFGCVHFQERE